MSTILGEVYVKINAIERKITDGGSKLLGLQNEKRTLILDARQLELDGKPDHEAFKLRYHHAVEDVKAAQSAMEDAGKRHKAAKEEHENALELLTKLEEKTAEQRQQEQAAAQEEGLPIIQIDKQNGVEGWRELPLSALGLSPAIVEKLTNPVHKHSDQKLGEITTLGGLVNLTSHSPYSMLKGISSTTSGKIEDAWMKFWEENPKYCQPPLIDQVDTAVESDLVVEASHDIADLVKHGLQPRVLKALQAGGHNTVASLQEILEHDDLLEDVVTRKGIKNVRQAYQSWAAVTLP